MFREISDAVSSSGLDARLRVGVLTFHRCINYGSYWQARSLVEGLRARGHDAVLLDYTCPRTERLELRCALQPLLPRRSSREDIRLHARKTRAFKEAIAALPMAPAFPLDQPERMEQRDLIVVGSDEVWNLCHPWYGGSPAFWGRGVPGRLISYAASFGNYDADAGIDRDRSALLDRFEGISVRDANSFRLVRDTTGAEPAKVLDPVLQFPIALAEPDQTEPFVALYGHSFSDGFARIIRRWADARGLKLVSIGYRNEWAHEHRIDADPFEFARLIAGSSAVITNFFHGCVFALLNGKPFGCAVSPYRMNKVRDLTLAVGAEAHLLHEDDAPERFVSALDHPLSHKITQAIARLREQSEDYLRAVSL